jgi:ATP adenylyltransferase
MDLPRFTPGTLWAAIARQTEHALHCGALQPIDTVQAAIDSGGLRFIVRQVSSLTRKEQQQAQTRKLHAQTLPVANPFLPYERDLFVADISGTHLALLNKFNVIDHHLLIVTRDFQRQDLLLDLADFEALMACMAEFDGIGFYNSAPEAGASQPHKHMQIVPLPLGDAGPSVPIEPLLALAANGPQTQHIPGLPFRHAFARLALDRAPPRELAMIALDCYRALLDAAHVGTTGSDDGQARTQPYNLLVTRHWMLVVPRSAERVEGVSVNALGFAGSLFVRDAAHLEIVERLGPMSVLQRVSLPVDLPHEA